jgi:hypothetical protein
MKKSPLSAVLLGGAVAGAIDISYAITFWALRNGVAPTRVLHSVASGLLGRASYSGGAATAALGLFLHFLIATIWAALFVTAARLAPALVRRPVLAGLAYGVVVYAVMNLAVIPLSRFPTKPSYPPDVLISGLLVHMLGIGLPIALAAARSARERRS